MSERIYFLPGHSRKLVQEEIVTRKKARKGIATQHLIDASHGNENTVLEIILDEIQNRACPFLCFEFMAEPEQINSLKRTLYEASVQIPLLAKCAEYLDPTKSNQFHSQITDTASNIQRVLEEKGINYLIILDKLETSKELPR